MLFQQVIIVFIGFLSAFSTGYVAMRFVADITSTRNVSPEVVESHVECGQINNESIMQFIRSNTRDSVAVGSWLAMIIVLSLMLIWGTVQKHVLLILPFMCLSLAFALLIVPVMSGFIYLSTEMNILEIYYVLIFAAIQFGYIFVFVVIHNFYLKIIYTKKHSETDIIQEPSAHVASRSSRAFGVPVYPPQYRTEYSQI